MARQLFVLIRAVIVDGDMSDENIFGLAIGRDAGFGAGFESELP
jgi:hypothetical protein